MKTSKFLSPLIYPLSVLSLRRRSLCLTGLWSQRRSPRTPGLVMHWRPPPTSTATASLTCWWEPRWRTSTGGRSTSTMEMAFTSTTIINRYLPLTYRYKLFGTCQKSIKLISFPGSRPYSASQGHRSPPPCSTLAAVWVLGWTWMEMS